MVDPLNKGDDILDDRANSFTINFSSLMASGVMVGLVAIAGYTVLAYREPKISPRYVNPHEFNIRVQDFDGNNNGAVIATYKGRECLFMEDENGNPVIRGYQVVTEVNQGKTSTKLEILARCK